MFVEKKIHSICGILNIDSNTRCISRVYVYIYIYMHICISIYIYNIYIHVYSMYNVNEICDRYKIKISMCSI